MLRVKLPQPCLRWFGPVSKAREYIPHVPVKWQNGRLLLESKSIRAEEVSPKGTIGEKKHHYI